MKLSRRSFLLVGCAIGAISLASSLIEARSIHGSGGGFNGGRSQVNPNNGQIGGDFPFINLLLNFGNLSLADNFGSPVPGDLDANDYPLPGSNAITVHGGVYCVGPAPAAYNAGTTYAAQVTGKGTIFCSGSVVNAPAPSSWTVGATTIVDFGAAHNFSDGMEAPISGVSGTLGTQLNGTTQTVLSHTTNTITLNVNTTGKSGSGGILAYGSLTVGVITGGRIVLDMSGVSDVAGAMQLSMGISATDATNPITKVALVRIGSEETRYNSGEIFGIDYLTKLQAANFGVIRHLNTLNTNVSNVYNWADRTPVGQFNYNTSTLKNSIYAGTASSATTVDYTGTLSGGTLTHGQQVTTKFPAEQITSVSNGANATVTLTSHGLSIGDPFNLFGDHGSVAPLGMPFANSGQTANYYVIATSFTANSFRFSTSFGGSAVTTTSSGSGNLYIAKTVVDTVVSFTNGSASIGWTTGPLPAVNDPVTFAVSSGNLPTNFETNGFIYYVKTSGAGAITVAKTVGGTAVLAGSPGTGTPSAVRCPTYNLNALGAKPILSVFATGVSVAGNSIPRARYNGDSITFGTLSYDAVIGCWLLFGAADGFVAQGIAAYWPPEVTFALSNHPMIKSHPWFCSPPLVLDPISDYMIGLATYIKSVQPAWMIPRYEAHNELWNTFFEATDIALAHATAYKAAGTWSADGSDEYCGKVASVLGQAIKTIYGGPVGGSPGALYQMIIGLHTGTFTDSGAAAASDNRLLAAQYVGQSVAAQSPYLKDPACNYSTHVCCDNYISPADRDQPIETTLAAAFNGVKFTGSLSGTTLSVTTSPSTDFGALASGMTIFGNGITTPVTISGSAPNWTLSSSANGTLASRPLYAGADMTAPQTYIESFGGAASGTNLAAHDAIYLVIHNWSTQSKFNNLAGAAQKMCGYEGGYSPDYPGTNSSSLISMLRFGGKNVTSTASFPEGLKTVTATNYSNFVARGGEFPSCFQFSGTSPTYNVWSVLEDIYQIPVPPQFNAFVTFNH